MAALAHLTGRQLPPLAYAHDTDHCPDWAQPSAFRPIVGEGVKPYGGGLWTSPVTARNADGAPVMTAWIAWWLSEGLPAEQYAHLTEIHPDPSARVLLIDTPEHLRAVVDTYPAQEIGRAVPQLADRWPDWAAIRDDGWHAVYLTEHGPYDLDSGLTGPNLYGWDCATVLWLHPAYTLGRTTAVRGVE